MARPYGGLQKTLYPPPIFRKSVIFNSIVFLTLRILVGTAGIQVEMELRIQLGEERGWRRPLVRPAGKQSFCHHKSIN